MFKKYIKYINKNKLLGGNNLLKLFSGFRYKYIIQDKVITFANSENKFIYIKELGQGSSGRVDMYQDQYQNTIAIKFYINSDDIYNDMEKYTFLEAKGLENYFVPMVFSH
jgi:hypothetical protein